VRKSVLLVSLAVVLSGCAYTPAPARDGFHPVTADPLSVRLLPPEGGFLRFLTTEPAHVAIFEIAPDRGVSLLYPQFREEAERVSRTGVNFEFLPWRAQGRWFYASAPFSPSFAALSRPTYLYIIASKTPLRVEDVRLRPATLRSTLGWRSFLASDLSGTLDDLESLVVADVDSDDWSSDLYIIWPEVPLDQPWQTRYVFFNCPDGRTVVLPLGWNINACPGTANLADATRPAPPASPVEPPGTIPETDSTGIPLKRRPEPGDTKPHQPLPPAAIGAMPADRGIIDRPRVYESAGARRTAPRADAPTRKIEREPAPRAEPRPAPPPRAEPQPAPSRSEPRPATPTPKEPAEPKPAGKP